MSKGGKGAAAVTPDSDLVLRSPPESTPAPDTSELIARFQLDTEALVATIRADHQRQLATMERKVAGLEDQWETAKAELAGIRKVIEEALHEMRGGVAEALNSQREAVKHAKHAADSVAVFDKLKASQPDFHRMVKGVQEDMGRVKDKITNVEGAIGHLSKRLDEFDIVANDYQDTKTTVRGLDPLVAGLQKDLVQRRTAGVR
jgi:uncharacterized coiled-coil DUF342 family protein